MTVRNFYIVKAYGAIQEPLTGVDLNVIAPQDWIKQHYPVLPPTQLRLERERHEIVSTSGPIDYLIVGSGPARISFGSRVTTRRKKGAPC